MAITIVKEDKFRSEGSGVNKSYDMVRVVVDMTIWEWRNLKHTLIDDPYFFIESNELKNA